MANVSSVKSKLFKAVSADPNGICAAQTTSGAADLSLDGAQVTSGVAADGSNMATTVTITSAGSDESGDDFEVVPLYSANKGERGSSAPARVLNNRHTLE